MDEEAGMDADINLILNVIFYCFNNWTFFLKESKRILMSKRYRRGIGRLILVLMKTNMDEEVGMDVDINLMPNVLF